MAYGDNIKIHITFNNDEMGGESVWAEELGNNHARINNLPFFTDAFGFNDIVEYKLDGDEDMPMKEYVRTIKQVTTSWGLKWEPTDRSDSDKVSEEWQQIAKHLKANDVKYESAIAGLFVIALPADKEDEENVRWLKALKYSSPISFMILDERFSEDNTLVSL